MGSTCDRSRPRQIRATRDIEIGTGDEAPRIGIQYESSSDEVFGLPGATDGTQTVDDRLPVGRLLTPEAVSIGFDESRRNVVDGDTRFDVGAGKVHNQIVLGALETGIDGEFEKRVGLLNAPQRQ